MRNFKRVAKLRIKIREENGSNFVQIFDISDLRIQFVINKSLSWAANSGIIKVWNLRQSTRNLIRAFGDEVELWAGYEDDSNLELLFVGQTSVVQHQFTQPEIITTLQCGDGNKYINEQFSSFSFGAGTPAKEVINYIAGLLNLKVDIPPADDLVYKTGFKSCAPIKDALTKACEYLDLQFIINNNMLSIVPKIARVSGAIYTINETTGMIGIPERFVNQAQSLYGPENKPQPGYKVNTSLKPQIQPKDTISLSSTQLNIANQLHFVNTIKHLGDTYGAEWLSNIEASIIL